MSGKEPVTLPAMISRKKIHYEATAWLGQYLYHFGRYSSIPLVYDDLLRDFPQTICWCRSVRYNVGELNVVDRFSILDHFSEIFAAVPTGLNFAYQINFKQLEFDAEEFKCLRKLIARVSIQRELPEAFRNAYTEKLRKALKCDLMLDEFIAVDSADDARFFEGLFTRLHDKTVSGHRFVPDDPCFSEDAAYRDFLETGIHSDFAKKLDCLGKSALSVDRYALLNLVFFENNPNGNIMTILGNSRAGHGKKKILFLAANPEDTARLRVDAEIKRIDDGLQAAKYRESFELRSKWAVTIESLTKAMLDEEPRIVHFSTHGESEGILIEGSKGVAQLIPIDALARIFRLFKGKVECVVLNACYSEEQAIAISRNSIYVVGMRSTIGDEAAIAFSVGFYQSLGAGKDYPFSFELGVTHVMTQAIDQTNVPMLWFDGKKVF
jgi:hypothetical protein